MGLERLFKLSVLINLVNGFSGPARSVTNAQERMIKGFESMKDSGELWMRRGAGMIATAAALGLVLLGPIQATFATGRAIGEVSSVGVKDFAALNKAATEFSNTWAGTSKAQFISAAYDIKGGINSLSDAGVAEFTRLAAMTAKATKSTTAEMTGLFATGYGIYKDFYGKMSDEQFGQLFASGIATTVGVFKSTGSEMAQAISQLGAAATSAKRPLEEQLAILGELQATMSGSEAGTKYRAFVRTAAKAGQELGISFVDSQNQLLPMVEILERLRARYGTTLDAMEKQRIQEAFGSDEAVALIDLFYGKVGQLRTNIDTVGRSMRAGTRDVEEMAAAMNKDPAARWDIVSQRFQNLSETIGTQLLPVILPAMERIASLIEQAAAWAEAHPDLTRNIFLAVAAVSALLLVGGTLIGSMAALRWAYATTRLEVLLFSRGLRSAADTGYLRFLYANDAVRAGLGRAGTALRSMGTGLVTFGRQAWTTAATQIPKLIAATWSFTAALLANPITWIIIGIVALGAAIYLLYRNWDTVSVHLRASWDWIVAAWDTGITFIKGLLRGVGDFFRQWGIEILAMVFPILGIPLLIIKHWDSIEAFFGSLFERVGAFFGGLRETFATAGRALWEAFIDGLKSLLMRPYELVKEGLAKVRKLLPFSDAKEGPLSTLTRSGRALMETLGDGIQQRSGLLRDITAAAFQDLMPGMQLAVAGGFDLSGIEADERPAAERRVGRLDLREIVRETRVERESIRSGGSGQGDVYVENAWFPQTPSSGNGLYHEMRLYATRRRKK